MRKVYEISFYEALMRFDITEYISASTGATVKTDPSVTGVMLPDTSVMDIAWSFVEECMYNLWETEEGALALEYLIERGLRETTIRALCIGYNPETRFDDPALWGVVDTQDILVPRGIVIPEIHIPRTGPEAGRKQIYSISIRRSPSEIEEYLAEHGKELPKYHVIRVLKARSLYTIGLESGKPASLHEGQINAAIAWQESGYGAAATQSADGAQDNLLTTASFLAGVSVWVLCQESDEAGRKSAKFWHEAIERSIIAHPPNEWDMDEYYLKGGNVKALIENGVKNFEKRWAIKNTWVKVEPVVVDAASMDYSDAISRIPRTQEEALPDEAVSLPQEEKQSPSTASTDAINACLRCGKPAKYQDRYKNWWCGPHVAAYRIMQDGGIARTIVDQETNTERLVGYRFGDMYWKRRDSVSMPVFEDGSWSMQEAPCSDVYYIKAGRENWLQFCLEAKPGDLWCAATEVHQALQGFAPHKPYRVVQKVKYPCIRTGCMHDTTEPHRHDNSTRWDGRYRYPAYYGKGVEVEGVTYNFCAHCLLAVNLLELAKERGWQKWETTGYVIEGPEEWLEYAATMDMFNVAYVFDPMRRQYPELWANVQNRLYK
jgi:hypothetical protein